MDRYIALAIKNLTMYIDRVGTAGSIPVDAAAYCANVLAELKLT